MAGAGVPVPMDDGLAMRGCGRLGTPHRKALSDRAAVYYNSRVRSWGLGRLQEMLRVTALAACLGKCERSGADRRHLTIGRARNTKGGRRVHPSPPLQVRKVVSRNFYRGEEMQDGSCIYSQLLEVSATKR